MLRFSAHVPGSSLVGGPPPGGSDVDTMVLFVCFLFPGTQHDHHRSLKVRTSSPLFPSIRSPSSNSRPRCSNRAIGEDRRKLLGQHIWKDILLNPSEGEVRHKSGIFYCVFQNIRDVQKEGMSDRPYGISV